MKQPFLFLKTIKIILLSACILMMSDCGEIMAQTHELQQIEHSITAEKLKKHVDILTSDSMQGRDVANGGEAKAGNYIADFFKAQKISDKYAENYHQCFSLIKHSTSCKASLNNKGITDFVFWGYDSTAQWKTLPVYFAGYHQELPDSIENSAIIVFAMDISDMIASVKTLRATHKNNVFLLFFGDDSYTYDYIKSNYNRYVNQTFNQQTNLFHNYFLPMLEEDPELQLFFFNDKFFKQATDFKIRNIKKNARTALTMKRTPINILPRMELKYRIHNETTNSRSCNIIGYVEGKTLKDEVVVVGAHYDHLGIDDEHQIFRGADDNASGTAALMAVAEYFMEAARNNIFPERSILFIAFGSEESGLLGSNYYVNHPLIPLQQTVAMINMDMIGRGYSYEKTKKSNYKLPTKLGTIEADRIYKDGRYVYAENYGDESSFLKDISKKQEAKLDLDVKNAPLTQKVMYRYASDQYQFMIHDIPVIVFFTGTHDDYHTVYDTPEKLNYRNMEKIAKLVSNVVWEIAN